MNTDGELVDVDELKAEQLRLDNEKIMLSIPSIVNITRQNVIDVIVTAVEGGINYWAAVSEYDCDNGTVRVHVEHEDCSDESEHNHYIIEHWMGESRYELNGVYIDPEIMFEKGIKVMDADRIKNWGPKYKGIINEIYNMDSSNADAMMQYAVLGEVVYG